MTVKAQPGAPRLEALDFSKGALVLIMVLYHWLNYFVGPNIDYRYLRFLTPSFIFVTGFLIAQVYLPKCHKGGADVSRRLFARGLKLLMIFVGLNGLRTVFLSRLSNASPLPDQLATNSLASVFVIGNVPIISSKLVAFYILVPISYLLMFAALLLFPYRRYKHTFHSVCLLCLLSMIVLRLVGIQSPNLEFVTVGLLGVLAGSVPIQRINTLVRHVSVLIVAYLCYIAAITVYNVPFPLLIVGVCLTLWAIYLIGLTEAAPSPVRNQVNLLGKHSLFGYIIQIAILQALSVAFRHVDIGRVGVTGGSFFAAFVLTVVAVGAVEWIKSRSVLADRLYRAAFA